jgi:hypothetical protein
MAAGVGVFTLLGYPAVLEISGVVRLRGRDLSGPWFRDEDLSGPAFREREESGAAYRVRDTSHSYW